MAVTLSSVPTTTQTRMGYQNGTVDGLLKNVYIPALNNVTFHATPLMEMFGDFGGTIDFASNKIIKGFKTQNAGGFKAIPEGGDWATSQIQKGIQGWEKIKYLNAYVELTGPAARTVKGGEGSYVDAISSAMDDTLKNARMNMERIIGGAGNGVLCTGTSASTQDAGTTVLLRPPGTGSTTSGDINLTAGTGGYSPVQWLYDGQTVSLQSTLGTDVVTGVVSNVDYAAGSATITIASTDLATSTLFYITSGAYNYAEDDDGTNDYGAADQCLEPNGLANLVDDGTTYSTIWHLTRSSYARALKSKVVAAGGAELDEELMMGWILDMVNVQQSVPNVCVVDPKSRLKYFSNRKDDRRFDMPVIDTPFGFRSTGVVIDQYTLMLQSLASLAPGTLYMLNTNAFKFAKATNGFEWVTNDTGGVFRQKEGSDVLYASAVNYMNFVCEDPKGQLKVTGLSY